MSQKKIVKTCCAKFCESKLQLTALLFWRLVTEIAKIILLLSCQMKTCGMVECGLRSVRICESEFCPRVRFRPPAGQNNKLAVKINWVGSMGTPWGHQRYGPLCPQPPRGAAPDPRPPENKQTRGSWWENMSPSVTTAWWRKAPPLLLLEHDHHNPRLPGSLSPGLKPD